MSLKDQKQQFVSDLLGGSLTEIYTIVGVSIVTYFSYKLFVKIIDDKLIRDIHDLIFNVYVLVGSVTSFSNRIELLYKGLTVPIIVSLLFKVFGKSSTPKQAAPKELLTPKSFITAYRSHMLILTNISILAVDFHIFPRRFAKVETWGTSVMDMGVGSFVFSMGLVNSRSLIKSALGSSKPTTNYLQLIITNFKKSIPMLVLGTVRLVSVKQLEYQEHVSEYGIHWNFFMTIGFLPIFIAILDPLFNLVPRFIVGFLIAIGYEVLLTQGVLKFILTSENRLDNIITMNKEGIFSFLGYLSIFIFGQSFGSYVLTNKATYNNLISFTNSSKKSLLTVSTTQGLIISTIFYQGLFAIVNESTFFYGVSRRLANFPYVMMIVSYNSAFLLGYDLVDRLVGDGTTGSEIMEAVNKNGLVFFLLGNLLTGLVNMSINTLNCNDNQAFGILLLYSTVLVSVVCVMHMNRVYIKI